MFFLNNDASEIEINSIIFYGSGGFNNIDLSELKKNPIR